MTTSWPTPTRVLAALVAGAATTAYYASPDFVASRGARGWTKAALLAVVYATSASDLRATLADAPWTQEPDGTPPSADEPAPSVSGTKVLLAGAAGLFVGSVVLMERWIFRRGQARAAAGMQLPHTRAALVLGALTTGLSLLPTPTDAPSLGG